MGYKSALLNETVFVGITLIPFVRMMEQRFRNPNVAIFVAGALYHLTAEFTGLNEWYLKHGASAIKKAGEIMEEVVKAPEYQANQGGGFAF